MATDPTRQSNRVCGLPLANFRNGVTDLPTLKSQVYPCQLLFTVAATGVKDKYLPVPVTRATQNALSGLYLCWYVLKKEWVVREELHKVESLTTR